MMILESKNKGKKDMTTLSNCKCSKQCCNKNTKNSSNILKSSASCRYPFLPAVSLADLRQIFLP